MWGYVLLLIIIVILIGVASYVQRLAKIGNAILHPFSFLMNTVTGR